MNKRWSITLICMLLVLPVLAWTQTATTGQIIGTVKDASGAVVSGAKVKLTSAAGQVREDATDGEGMYHFPLLAPGAYTIVVEAPGFKTVTYGNVIVRVTETSDVSAALTVSGTAESVSVTAEPPLVQTTSATTGRVIGDTEVRQLPLPTRNFQQLLTLSPGTVAGLANNTELGRGDSNIAVNGQRTTSNNVIIDGTSVNSPGTQSTPNVSVPAPDAIQEFIVQTSLYDASQGRNTGGNVAVVTKSGTNAFHGSVYEFLRNEKLNANDFFLKAAGRPRPVLKRNQFGGTFGGPIIKDKTFFFLSYQGTRERNGASLQNSLTTTFIPAGLTDDRSTATLTALATAPPPVGFGLPFLDPTALALLQATLPDGRLAIPSAAANTEADARAAVNTPLSGISRYREDQLAATLDHQVSAANRLTAKFFVSNSPQFQSQFTFVGANPLQVPGYGGNIFFRNRVLTISDTHVFNPNLINQARFGYSRIKAPSTPEEPFDNSDFGITNPLASEFPGMANIQVLGAFSIGPTALADQQSYVQTFEWADTLTWTKGRHFLRLGGELRRYHVDFYFNFFTRGQINFANFPSFLMGVPQLALLGNGVRDRGMRATDFAFFLQDDIRVNEHLTLNGGIRVGFNGGISEVQGRLVNFDETEFASNTLPCTLAAPCMPPNGFHVVGQDETLNPNDWNVAPRFGFALKPMTDKSLVVRGGMGVYFDRFSTRVANLQIFNYPFDVVGLIFGAPLGPATFTSPFPASVASATFPIDPAQIPSPLTFTVFGFPSPLPISGLYVHPEFRTPYVYHYNLGLQWEPVKNWMVEVGYVGSKGTKLINVYTFNQGATGTPPYNASGLSNNKALNGFQQAKTDGISHYDSLQASLTKRFSKGLQFLASYTWSKAIDDNSGAPTNEFAALPGDQQDKRSQRGLSDFDRTHRFVFSGVYDLPKFYSGDSGIAKRLVNGWELTGILTLQSGSPFSVVCASGSALLNRADYLGGDLVTPGDVRDRLGEYFETSSFQSAASCLATVPSANVAPYGTSGRNIIRGPNQKNVDLGIVKFIPLNERHKLEFRTEFFNIFNTVNFANPNNNVAVSSTVGQITQSSTGPRVIQFALKYSF